MVHAYNSGSQEVMAGKQEFIVLKGVCAYPWTSSPHPCLSNSSSNKTL